MPEVLYSLSLLKKLAHNNQEIIRKMILVFLEQAPAAVAEIKAAYAAGKYEMVSAVAHKIKPTFGYFAIAVEKDIVLIELLANLKEDTAEINRLIHRLDAITQKVIAEMEEDLAANKTSSLRAVAASY
jgi:HPt (histidine-containing phosphotransfer) domain-containing protein